MSFEEYKRKYYGNKLREAIEIVESDVYGLGHADETSPSVLMFNAFMIQAVYNKIARDEYCLKQDYESGGPEKTGPQVMSSNQYSPPASAADSPRGRAGASEVSFRKPSQTIILPDEYAKFVDTTETRYIQLNQFVSKEDWNGMNEIAKQCGYTKWNSKERRWEKQ